MQATMRSCLTCSGRKFYLSYDNFHYAREYNIKMDLQELGCGGMDWVKPAQDMDRWWAVVNVVMHIWFA